MKTYVRIGSRSSQLALYQAELTKNKIQNALPMIRVEIIKIKTSGDMIRRRSADPFDDKPIYVREIETALSGGEVDVAVHSAKHLSVSLPESLRIGAVLARDDERDCFVSPDNKKIAELPLGARIGTNSLAKKMQLLRWNPELVVEEAYGSIEARFKKMMAGEYDGIVLAYASAKRLGLTNHVTEVLSEKKFYPLPGQGIIAVQSRTEDLEISEILHILHHQESGIRLRCERSFLKHLEGGYQFPCGVWTQIDKDRLKAGGAVYALDRHDWAEGVIEGDIKESEDIGAQLADLILNQGGRRIVDEIRCNYLREQ